MLFVHYVLAINLCEYCSHLSSLYTLGEPSNHLFLPLCAEMLDKTIIQNKSKIPQKKIKLSGLK